MGRGNRLPVSPISRIGRIYAKKSGPIHSPSDNDKRVKSSPECYGKAAKTTGKRRHKVRYFSGHPAMIAADAVASVGACSISGSIKRKYLTVMLRWLEYALSASEPYDGCAIHSRQYTRTRRGALCAK
jgi:hypothetical protein